MTCCFLLQWICICVIIIHSASHASSAPSKRDTQTAQIDEFIEKILGSDKFELLADKIADRAAEKIINIQMRSGNKKGNNGEDLEEIKEEYTTTETPRIEKHRGKPGNIDIQAAMEKFATIPEEKLSLKYQNFIKGNAKANNDLSEETTIDKHHRTMRDKKMEKDKHYLEHDETTKRNVNSEPRVKYNKLYKGVTQYHNKHVSDSRSSQKKSLRQSPKYDNDEEPPKKSIRTQKKDNSEQIEYEVKIPSGETSKTSKDNNQNDDSSRIFRTNEKKSTIQNINEKEETDETDAETSQENQVSDENDKEIVQVDDIYETKELKNENSNVTDNITVRKEGAQLFAFDPSPEYAEYHEKFSKLKKKLMKRNGIVVPTTLPA